MVWEGKGCARGLGMTALRRRCRLVLQALQGAIAFGNVFEGRDELYHIHIR